MNNQNMKIENPKTQTPETSQMTDRDFINDVLSTEKYMTGAYSIAMNEASHQHLYQDINQICMESQDCQRELFNLMFQKGWYSFEAVDQQKLTQSYQQFSGYSNQFPYTNNTIS